MATPKLESLVLTLHEREARPVEVVEHAVQLIEADRSNAFTATNFEYALQRASVLEQLDDTTRRSLPLYGVPVAVKEMQDVKGMRTTYCSVPNRDAEVAAESAQSVQQLEQLGAIVIGKTNQSEYAAEGYGANPLFGITHNPWNAEFSSGGSSGGSAVALARGLVPVATATDGGGSVRIPASFNGLLGLKPTQGVIANDVPQDWLDLSTNGILATCAADLAYQYNLQEGALLGDFDRGRLSSPCDGRLPNKAYLLVDTTGRGDLPSEVNDLFRQSVASFSETFDVPLIPVTRGELFCEVEVDDEWRRLVTADHVAKLGRDNLAGLIEQLTPGAQAFFEYGMSVTLDEYVAARRRRHQALSGVQRLVSRGTVVLSPTVASSGWAPQGEFGGEYGWLDARSVTTKWHNYLGVPSISLPFGQFANGLPFGLQVATDRFDDRLLIEIARLWEMKFSWQQAAPGSAPFVDSFYNAGPRVSES